MRISGITSRIISYDVSAIYGDLGPPQEIAADYRYSFDTIHTDEGIDGHSMQFGWMGEGQAMGHVLHQAYGRFLMGRDVNEHERLWQDLRRQNRHEYNLTDTLLGTIDIALWDIRGKAAGLPIARMLGLARTTIPTYATAITVNPTPEQVYEETKLRIRQGYRGFKIQFWDGLEQRHPAVPGCTRGGGPGLSAVPGRGRLLFVDRGGRGGPRARRARLHVVRGAAARPAGVPAQAPGRRDPDAGADERDVAPGRAAGGASDRRRGPGPR